MRARILLADLIKKRGVTKKWLSEQTGIREGTIRDYCQGWANSININHIGALCTVLECSISELIDLVDEETGKSIRYPKGMTEEDKDRLIENIIDDLRPWLEEQG